jgi:hypothetical protein
MSAKQGPDVLFRMPSRTNCILLISLAKERAAVMRPVSVVRTCCPGAWPSPMPRRNDRGPPATASLRRTALHHGACASPPPICTASYVAAPECMGSRSRLRNEDPINGCQIGTRCPILHRLQFAPLRHARVLLLYFRENKNKTPKTHLNFFGYLL